MLYVGYKITLGTITNVARSIHRENESLKHCSLTVIKTQVTPP